MKAFSSKLQTKLLSMFKITKLSTILYLIVFLLVVLAIYLVFFKNQIKEGLISSSNIQKIKDILKTYNDSAEKTCKEGIDKISKLTTLSTPEGVVIRPILADDNYTNSAKIEKLIETKSTNKDVNTILAEVNGKKYTATQLMLNSLNELNITDDNTFNALLKQQTTSPVISGKETTAFAIKQYLDTIASAPSM